MTTVNERAINLTSTVATIAAGLVILAAGVLGYTALYDLFISIGLFAAWLGIFFPLLFDLAEVAAAVSVFNAKLQGEDDRFAWIMVLLFTILGIVANVGHATAAWWVARIDTLQVIIAIFATSLFPLSVALVTHLVKRVIGRAIARRGHVATLAELAAQIDQTRCSLAEALTTKESEIEARQAEVDRINNQIKQAAAKLEQVKIELKAGQHKQMVPRIEELNAARFAKIEQRREQVLILAREGMSAPAIASELGVSASTVKRDLTALNGKARSQLVAESSLEPNGSDHQGHVNDSNDRTGLAERLITAARDSDREDLASIVKSVNNGPARVNGAPGKMVD